MSSNYPPGAEHDPRAPYNEIEVPEKEFNVYVEFAVKKVVPVTTNDYLVEQDFDEDGYYCGYDFSETDWRKAYKDGNFSICDMLEELRLFIEKELPTLPERSGRYQYLKRMHAECQGWEEEIVDICKD